ncbi:MAG: amidohydrolase family protein [Chloroflexi bacterium]|nr:amidohydrolase family protein [Chloroflexota bacterium]
MIIDFHTHIAPPWLRENRDEYIGRDPCFDTLYSNPKARLVTADELVASMDNAGVDVSVALNIGWTDHELCVATNDYILDSVSKYSGRLIGFCAVQPSAGEAALREIERCARAGARGIGELRPDIQGFDVRDSHLIGPLASALKQYDMLVLTHSSEPVGHRYPGKGSVTPELLFSFVSAMNGATVICAHWGGGLPFYYLMPEVAEALKNAYFDTAATHFLYQPAIYSWVADIAGVDRILMGSDYPLISQERHIREIRSLKASERLKAGILGENAHRLLFPGGRGGKWS